MACIAELQRLRSELGYQAKTRWTWQEHQTRATRDKSHPSLANFRKLPQSPMQDGFVRRTMAARCEARWPYVRTSTNVAGRIEVLADNRRVKICMADSRLSTKQHDRDFVRQAELVWLGLN